MNLDISSLQKALLRLEKSMAYLNSEMSRRDPDLKEEFEAAAVQVYEFTYELAFKMIRRQLSQISASPQELKEMAFMDVIRSATEAGLIREALPFKRYREARNLTSHTYDQGCADEIISLLDSFAADVRFLVRQLESRNARH